MILKLLGKERRLQSRMNRPVEKWLFPADIQNSLDSERMVKNA